MVLGSLSRTELYMVEAGQTNNWIMLMRIIVRDVAVDRLVICIISHRVAEAFRVPCQAFLDVDQVAARTDPQLT